MTSKHTHDSKTFPMPPDGVVKSQSVDIVAVIVQLLSRLPVVDQPEIQR
jgi:hypothetical protein